MDTSLGSTFKNYILLAVFFFEEEEEEEEEESLSEGALRSKLVIAPFVERFQAAAILSKSY